MPLPTYEQLLSDYTARYEALNKKLGWLSFVRLAVFIGMITGIYFFLAHNEWPGLIIAGLLLVVFLYCIRLYDVIKNKSDFIKALMTVNGNELSFLQNGTSAYADGKEYTDPHHPYSYDLDLFGEGSLYSFLNRTTTVFGKKHLASSLLQPDATKIEQRQAAIKELAANLAFRQNLQANGSIQVTDQKELDKLKSWISAPPAFRSRSSYYLLFIFPLTALAVLGYYFVTGSDPALNLFFALFILNLFVTFSFAKKMMKQMAISTAVTKVLRQFAGQLKEIEKQPFTAPLLQEWRQRLMQGSTTASQSIQQLASLFNYLDFILNLLVSVLLNGFFLFHVHILFALDRWKEKHGRDVMNWLDVIGEFESLHCYAGFAFNNPDFCYPILSSSEDLQAIALGHPLISSRKRVTNDVSFTREKFVVLTGSNMSGKSTFLRTLGVNLVLARAGSAVCAKSLLLFPYDLYVSMRITDSLQDSESLFYAELKRLQSIIYHLRDNNKTFVILDEILKGTNSNDKHGGTVGLIRKLAIHRACGIIATHDLTIAGMSAEYTGYMTNKCFESVIVNDELVFDYKLKDGVCSRLNASFLMKKMGIID